MGQSLKDDYSALEQLTDKAWESTLIKQDKGYLVFRTAEFLHLPLSIQRYLIRRAIDYHLPGLREVGFDCIERSIKLLVGNKQNSQMDLIGGLRLVKEGEQFWLATDTTDLTGDDFPAISPTEKLILMTSSTSILNNGWCLEVEEIDKYEADGFQWDGNLDPFEAWMDVSVLDLPLIARARVPGDYIRPFGLYGHSIKISDLMINLKLPKQARATWPLICSGSEIVWVPGYRMSELARIKQSTSRVIHLRLHRSRAT
jgi:tRNA(Ile)-lysidine synthase